jgi:hypothetical protein
MSVVTAAALRSISSDTFDDLLPEGVAVETIRAEESMLTVAFTADLAPEVEAAIRDRMTSRDDAELTARANIARLRRTASATTATTDDVKALALAVSAYLLGIEAP